MKRFLALLVFGLVAIALPAAEKPAPKAVLPKKVAPVAPPVAPPAPPVSARRVAPDDSSARGPRAELWLKVEEAINKGLPKTAIAELDPIIAGALKDKAYGEATKALARKLVLEGHIQGNKPEEKILRLEAEIAKSSKEMAPLLDTILANWYWHYFQQNRWRFMQRTQTATEPGKDFTTWDLARLFAEIDKRFQTALAADVMLKATPVSAFDDLLVKGTIPDSQRPTLYDFVARDALRFYQSGEQGAAKPQDAFQLAATSPAFDSAEKFMSWKIETTDADSPIVKALRLHQNLLKFHAKDKESAAFIDADIERLVYANNVATGEEKPARYKAALKTLVDRWADHALSAMAIHSWARQIQSEGDLVEARKLALRAANAFKDSPGGKLCQNLIQEIETKSAHTQTERVWNAPWPKITINYRNVTEVHFRAVPWDWNRFMSRKWWHPGQLDQNERKELLKAEVAHSWSVKLPPTEDFKERVEEIPAPENLKPGYYFIIASHDPNFGDQNNHVTFADMWVSDLALVIRSRFGQLEGFVLEANSGEPLAGAEVESWHRDNQGNRTAQPKVTTDTNGLFSVAGGNNQGVLVRVRHNGRVLGGQQDHYVYNNSNKPQPYSHTVFFTDRSLYRPGQTVQYKGLCLRVNTEADDYQVLSNEKLTVIFVDSNGKEIAKQDVKANDYGSFSGSFTAPRDRMMGQMQLRVLNGPNGAAYFGVEEYKRPKFRVEIEAPKTAAKLNGAVALTGKAEAYTGAAIDGANVRWRVVREVRYPAWWGWYYWWRTQPSQGSQEIANGTAKTDAGGSFKVEFFAKPDPAVLEKDEPIFVYTIHSDVTDTTGETRSAQRGIQLGYTALSANLSAEDWQVDDNPVALTLKTTTLDGEPQTAEGSLKIYKLKEPVKVERPSLGGGNRYQNIRRGGKLVSEPKPDPTNVNSWELGEVVATKGFTSDKAGKFESSFKLAAGAYRVIVETQDRFGKKVTAKLPVQVLKPAATKLALKIPQLFAAPKWTTEPGEEFMALWGTGYDAGRAFVEIEHRQKFIQRYWTKPGNTQEQIKQAVTEAMRGGFTVHVTRVRENRAYIESRHVDVPWSNKDLAITWEHFTSKLGPNQKETWTAVISGPKAQKAAAEMVATLYDESLDAYRPHNWLQKFGFFRRDYTQHSWSFENHMRGFQHLQGQWTQNHIAVNLSHRSFPNDLVYNYGGYGFGGPGGRGGNLNYEGNNGYRRKGGEMLEQSAMQMPMAAAAPGMANMARASLRDEKQSGGRELERDGVAKSDRAGSDKQLGEGGGGGAPGPDLSKVSARKNLNETAFFFPHLVSDTNGVVRLTFTMPEALTQWKFMGFAHDKELRSGFIQDKAVTAKDLMVQPNPPRFLREGDQLEFTVKVSNQTAARQSGKVALHLNEAWNNADANKLLANLKPELDFDIPAKESRTLSWRLKVPDGAGFLTYKAVGSTGRVSDGEEGHLPVLSRRIFVTESLPLPIRGKLGGGEVVKKFDFTKLLKSGSSDTLKHQSLTVQMVSQPSWYAVMALPYLMEYPHEGSEQIFNRLYANSLARSIANSDPKIRRVFDLWKGTPALDSPLEKNQDLKSVMIEETPWLRQAQAESQARKNVGVLFDDNRLNTETLRQLQKLRETQLGDGMWPWFPGGRGNEYITLYITTGFGRLRHLGVDVPVDPALKSLQSLDTWMDRIYRDILRHGKKDENHLSTTVALYLYGRSFFLKDKPVAAPHKEAFDYWTGQAKKYWLQLNHRQSQGHLALALHRVGDKETAQGIMRSVKERSVANEELGMFWRDLELSWWWYRAPIETQAVMIEAFDEVMGDKQAVEDCQVWLLKQKQTQDWKTTKATADAVYALLLRGANKLASDALVEVSLGGSPIKPEKLEPGTGFYEKRFTGPEVKAKLGEITVKKVDEGVSWGSVHWQYLEDISKITPHEGTPLKLKKTLFTKVHTKKGPVLEPVKAGAVSVGDELVVRIELRTDRDMEYVHLKDQRGSGTEPVNVLSRYRYQDGLGYYETTRDVASHFFIDYLPKGVYVFEYTVRVQHRGLYQTGIAEIQCLYAPEFNSHSESFNLNVK